MKLWRVIYDCGPVGQTFKDVIKVPAQTIKAALDWCLEEGIEIERITVIELIQK